MTVQRSDPPVRDLVVPCGQEATDGWITLPAGWTLGRPVPAWVVRSAEAAWQEGRSPEATGSGGFTGLLLALAVVVAAVLATLGRIRRRAAPGVEDPEMGAGDGSSDPSPRLPGSPPGSGPGPARDPDGDEPGKGPIRTRPPSPAGEPIVVQLRRPTPRPDAVPVRLPPHVAAALTRARAARKTDQAPGARSPRHPSRGGPETPPDAEPAEAGGGPDPEKDGPSTGRSWLVGD